MSREEMKKFLAIELDKKYLRNYNGERKADTVLKEEDDTIGKPRQVFPGGEDSTPFSKKSSDEISAIEEVT